MSKSDPIVSVLLPVYNAEKYLSEAIDSVLNQTYSNFELFLVNDGSTDSSEKIIDSYSDARIVKVNNDRNLGLIATLNKALTLGKGKYIARMDADDICFPERFQKQVEFLESHPDVAVVGSNVLKFGSVNEQSNMPLTDEQIRLTLYFENAMAHPSVMMRSSIVDEYKIQYKKELVHMEDWGFWMDISAHGKLHNLNEVLLKYRMEGQNITVKNADSLEPRVKTFYRMYLPKVITNCTENDINFQWAFTKSIYKEKNLDVLQEKIEHLYERFQKMGFDSRTLNDFFRTKTETYFFGVCNAEPRKAIRFIFKFRIWKLKKIIYALKLFIKGRN